MNNHKEEVSVLKSYLKSNMTVDLYDLLVPRVFTTPHRKKFIFKKPEKASYSEIKKMVDLGDLDTKKLIEQTALGRDKLLANEWELLGFEIS